MLSITLFVTIAFSMFWLIHAYTIKRLAVWVDKPLPRHTFKYLALYIALFLAYKFYYESSTNPDLVAFMRSWFLVLGWFLLAAPILLIADTSRLFLYLFSAYRPIKTAYGVITQPQAGWLLIVIVCILHIVGWYNFNQPISLVQYTLYSSKVTKPHAVIHLSDVQLGSTSPQHVKKIATKIQSIAKTIPLLGILNTGDHVDTANYLAEQLQPLNFSNIPTLFSLGNHEFYHNHHRILKTLQSFDYRILRTNNSPLGELNIIGIDDDPSALQVATNLQSNRQLIKPQQYNILLYHRPLGSQDAAAMGIDLMLSGHTHGGQFFPFTHIVSLLHDHVPQGMSKVNNMYLHLTDGAGLWGPRLRLGSRNEIALIRILPL